MVISLAIFLTMVTLVVSSSNTANKNSGWMASLRKSIGMDYVSVNDLTADPTPPPTYAPFFPFAESEPPTYAPTKYPSFSPTQDPTATPTISPTYMPSAEPTDMPTYIPTALPTETPTATPTDMPSYVPSITPTSAAPSVVPTAVPSHSFAPTMSPTTHPTTSASPTILPPTFLPTHRPSLIPTAEPTSPTVAPTILAQSITFAVAQVLQGISSSSYNSKLASNNAVMAASIASVSPAVNPADITFSSAVVSNIVIADTSISSKRNLRTGDSKRIGLQQNNCMLSYIISIPNTQTVGFVNGEAAYNAISLQLRTASTDGLFTATIRAEANTLKVSDMNSVSSGSVVTSNYQSGNAYSRHSSSPSKALNGGTIAGIVIAVLVFVAILIIGVYKYRSWMEEDTLIERKGATATTQIDATGTGRNDSRNMSTASNVSEFLGQSPSSLSDSSSVESSTGNKSTTSSPFKTSSNRPKANITVEYGTEMTTNPLMRAHSSIRRKPQTVTTTSAADSATTDTATVSTSTDVASPATETPAAEADESKETVSTSVSAVTIETDKDTPIDKLDDEDGNIN